jgi:hypothetical protein
MLRSESNNDRRKRAKCEYNFIDETHCLHPASLFMSLACFFERAKIISTFKKKLSHIAASTAFSVIRFIFTIPFAIFMWIDERQKKKHLNKQIKEQQKSKAHTKAGASPKI